MKYLTQNEAAEFLKVKPHTIRKWRQGGTFYDMRSRATGRGHLFSSVELEELQKGKRKPKYPNYKKTTK